MSFKDVRVGSYCFMDYETTGVDTSRGTSVRPIQIGCVFTSPDLEVLVESQNLIKWDDLMLYENWPNKWVRAFRVHKIPLDKIKEEGVWPYQVKKDLIEITSEVQQCLLTC